MFAKAREVRLGLFAEAARWASGAWRNFSPLFDQDKSDFEIDAVLRNLSVFNDDFLFLDPRAFNILQCLDRAIDACLDGILEALFRARNDFRNSGYRHCIFSFVDWIPRSDPLTCCRRTS